MSETREVFEMVTKQTEPDLRSWKQQEQHQRKRAKRRKAGAFAVVGALVVAGGMAFALQGDDTTSGVADQRTQSPTGAVDTTPIYSSGFLGYIDLTCLGIHDELVRHGVYADVVAGPSLGKIPACAAIGCCTAEDAVALAAERGRLMAREAARRPGGMVMVTAASRLIVEEAVAFAGSGGIAAIAAHNTPNQWVVSGEWTALRRLATRCPATPVAVAGAWHSDVLAGVV